MPNLNSVWSVNFLFKYVLLVYLSNLQNTGSDLQSYEWHYHDIKVGNGMQIVVFCDVQ